MAELTVPVQTKDLAGGENPEGAAERRWAAPSAGSARGRRGQVSQPDRWGRASGPVPAEGGARGHPALPRAHGAPGRAQETVACRPGPRVSCPSGSPGAPGWGEPPWDAFQAEGPRRRPRQIRPRFVAARSERGSALKGEQPREEGGVPGCPWT